MEKGERADDVGVGDGGEEEEEEEEIRFLVHPLKRRIAIAVDALSLAGVYADRFPLYVTVYTIVRDWLTMMQGLKEGGPSDKPLSVAMGLDVILYLHHLEHLKTAISAFTSACYRHQCRRLPFPQLNTFNIRLYGHLGDSTGPVWDCKIYARVDGSSPPRDRPPSAERDGAEWLPMACVKAGDVPDTKLLLKKGNDTYCYASWTEGGGYNESLPPLEPDHKPSTTIIYYRKEEEEEEGKKTRRSRWAAVVAALVDVFLFLYFNYVLYVDLLLVLWTLPSSGGGSQTKPNIGAGRPYLRWTVVRFSHAQKPQENFPPDDTFSDSPLLREIENDAHALYAIESVLPFKLLRSSSDLLLSKAMEKTRGPDNSYVSYAQAYFAYVITTAWLYGLYNLFFVWELPDGQRPLKLPLLVIAFFFFLQTLLYFRARGPPVRAYNSTTGENKYVRGSDDRIDLVFAVTSPILFPVFASLICSYRLLTHNFGKWGGLCLLDWLSSFFSAPKTWFRFPKHLEIKTRWHRVIVRVATFPAILIGWVPCLALGVFAYLVVTFSFALLGWVGFVVFWFLRPWMTFVLFNIVLGPLKAFWNFFSSCASAVTRRCCCCCRCCCRRRHRDSSAT
jgi:hypothetical protein